MLATLNDLRQAISSDGMVPAFQPIVALRTGEVKGFEVLARWQHAEHGPILPENFIGLAEEHGLIDELMRQVVGKAFRAMPEGTEAVGLAVNVSPVQLQNPDLADELLRLAAAARFATKRIIVEITESALLGDLEMARRHANQWHRMGCRLAIDDFGTGYANLTQLKSLAFDEIKIDRSFTASMLEQRESRKIVAAVIGLAQSLGLTTVAEGVENEEQAELLLWLGCDLAQGWLYGRPQAAEAIPQMMMSTRRSEARLAALANSRRNSTSLQVTPAARLAQLKAIYEGVPVGLCFLDRRLRYVNLNQRYAEFDGVAIEDHIGKTVQEIIPQVFPAIEPFLQRALHGEAIFDEPIIRPSREPGGPEMETLITYQPAKDETGEVVGISVSVLDVTEMRQMQDALAACQDQYSVLIDQNPNVPWLLDAQGNVVDVSRQWVEITGLTKEQSMKLGWLEALHPEDVKRTLHHLVRSVEAQQPMDVEYRIWDVKKGWRWMHARGAPRLDAEGTVLYWYGTLEDIDERKAMEAKLLEMSRFQEL